MSKTLSGKFRSKSTEHYMKIAKELKAKGYTCQNIADTLAAKFPSLKGLSKATASYWSRGITGAPSIRRAIESKRKDKRAARIDRLLTNSALAETVFDEQLEAILRKKVKLSLSHRRRLIRLLREIFNKDQQESHRDQVFAVHLFDVMLSPKLRPKLTKFINDTIEDGYVQGQLNGKNCQGKKRTNPATPTVPEKRRAQAPLKVRPGLAPSPKKPSSRR